MSMHKVINVDGKPRSSCCKAEIECQKDYTDTHVFVADGIETYPDGTKRVRYQFVRTYDGVDGENWTVTCRDCGQAIEDDDIDWYEA